MTQERNMDRQNDLVPGQIVRSKAGRDKDKVFLVLDVLDAKHVLVADGHYRTFEHAKKKRTRHLQPFNWVLPDFERVKNSRDFNNAKIRKLLREFQESYEEA